MDHPSRDHYNLRTRTGKRYVGFSSDEEQTERGKWRKQWNKLMKKTPELRDAMDLNHFVSVSLESISGLLAENQSLPATIPSLASLQYPRYNQNELINLERECE